MIKDNKFIHNENYVYEPMEIGGLYVHPERVYKGYEKPFIAKVDLSYSYNFYNGYVLDIKKGDKVFIIFNSPINSPINYEWEYRIRVVRDNEIVNHWSDKVRDVSYNYKDAETMLENFKLQLEGKMPCIDKIYDNQKPIYKIKTGDVFISIAWDNGFIAKEVELIENNNIYYREYYMLNRRGKGDYNYSYHKNRSKTDIKWLFKYSCKIDVNYKDIINNKVLYSDLRDKVFTTIKREKKEMFNTSLTKLTNK